jgi:hypothetical protein
MSRRTMPPHLFREDTTLPPAQDGKKVCRCGLVGEPGDAHHTMPDAPQDVRQLAAGEYEES